MEIKNGALIYAVLAVLLAAALLFSGCTAANVSEGNFPLEKNNDDQGENEGNGKKPPVEEPPVNGPQISHSEGEDCNCLEKGEIILDENGYPDLRPVCYELKNKIWEDWKIHYERNPYTQVGGWVENFYGVYNGSVVFAARWSYAAFWSAFIDGVIIGGFIGPVNVWKEGNFFGLEEAYGLGLLGKKDIENIAYYAGTRRYVSYSYDPLTGEPLIITWRDRL